MKASTVTRIVAVVALAVEAIATAATAARGFTSAGAGEIMGKSIAYAVAMYGCFGALVWADVLAALRRRRFYLHGKSAFLMLGMPLISSVGITLGVRAARHSAAFAALCGAAQLALWLVVPASVICLAYWEAERAEARR